MPMGRLDASVVAACELKEERGREGGESEPDPFLDSRQGKGKDGRRRNFRAGGKISLRKVHGELNTL